MAEKMNANILVKGFKFVSRKIKGSGKEEDEDGLFRLGIVVLRFLRLEFFHLVDFAESTMPTITLVNELQGPFDANTSN